MRLDWRARHGPVGAKNATVAGFGPKQRVAANAFVEIDAGVGWHGFNGYLAAGWASQLGLKEQLRIHFVVPILKVAWSLNGARSESRAHDPLRRPWSQSDGASQASGEGVTWDAFFGQRYQ